MTIVSKNSRIVELKKIESSKVPATTSLAIAEVFDREHKHVLETIKGLVDSGKFGGSDFRLTSYKDIQNKNRTMYVLNELFATVLIMGFTGGEALEWKIEYAKEFARMRSLVPRTKGDPSSELNKTVNAILKCARSKQGKETDSFQYSNLAVAVNKEVFGEHRNDIRKEITPEQQTKLNKTLAKVAKHILDSI
jgi:Rha family phage regulatory protein